MGAAVAHRSLTDQQGRAVACREVSVILSSGAGCGKTHVLTERYLSHLAHDGAEVGQIVAITFTDRAARQMRDRIRKAVTAQLQAAATDAEADRWARHLRALETAQISTIHAFCSALLRQHAVEAGLDPRFEVLEDFLAANLEVEALTGCLQGLLTAQTQPGEDLRELILLYGWKPTLAAVQHLMHGRTASAWERWLARPAEQIAAAWQRYARSDLLPQHVTYLVAACPKIARCLWLLHNTPCLGPKMAARVRSLLEETPRLAEAADLAAKVEELVQAAKVGGERAKAWPSEAAYASIKAAFEGFREELPARLQLFLHSPDDPAAAARVGQRFLRVADEAARAFGQRKRQAGVVDFQDLLVLARDLLRDHPAVRERLQRRYQFLLIDELQDTDPVQLELVESLTGAGLTTGKLFAVGDYSQSIYRFRGADVYLFRDLRQRVPHEGRLGLTVNFRSQPAILDFTNALLGHRLEDYERLQAHHPQVNPGPCVEFLWSPRGDKESATEARCREADWIARRIAAMVCDQEALVVDRERGGRSLRPVRQGDVVLLFRVMSNVELYEAALRRHGLDYYLVGGRAFFAQQEIYDLLNLLRALENPQDAVSLAGTLRSPFCCLSDEALFLLGRSPGGLWAGLHEPSVLDRLPADQREVAGRAQRFLDRWRGLKDRLPIAQLLGEVFADSGYDAATQLEYLGDRKLANLWKLLDLARAFDRSGLFGLAEFIQRLGDLVRTQPREEQAATQPESADVVRLLTIHQAKGLEFPIVFIPDLAAVGGGPRLPVAHWDPLLGCVARPPPDDPPPFTDFGWRLWEAKETIEDWREDLRTLYVACTRAQDYLVLSAALTEPFSPANAWMLALAERFDLRKSTCLDPGIPPQQHPKVWVSDRLSPPPARPTQRRLDPAVPLEPADGWSRDVAAVPVRFQGQGIIPVGALERYFRERQAARIPFRSPLQPSDLALQFTAEDGSDRTTWMRPWDRITTPDGSQAAQRDQVLRFVLERWDFRIPQGWRPLLQQALDCFPSQDPAQSRRCGWEEVLAAFADSALRRKLAAARTCRREVEFLLSGPRPTSTDQGPLLRGALDCLWQDRQRDWHLLAYTTARVQPNERREHWRVRKPSLVLGACAVHEALGVWPRTLTLYFFEPAAAIVRSGKHFEHASVLADVQAALNEILGQALSPPE